MKLCNLLITAVTLTFTANVNALFTAEVTNTTDFPGTTLSDSSSTGMTSVDSGLGDWYPRVEYDFSSPLIAKSLIDEFDLLSANIRSAEGAIFVHLMETDFSKNSTNKITYDGMTDGLVSIQSYADASISAYGTGTLLSDSGTMTSSFFSSGKSYDIDFSEPNSLSMFATITHDSGFRVSSFDDNTKVPEHSSIALLGLGLLGFSLACRKQASKS